MMPRAPDGGACDHAFVERTTEVRAVCIVSLKPISFSPDEDAGFADNASEDSTVGRGLDFDPLGQIEAVILIVAHPVPRVAGNTHLTCGVPLAQKDDRFAQVKIWTGACNDREAAHTPANPTTGRCHPSRRTAPSSRDAGRLIGDGPVKSISGRACSFASA
jgi:hypothetical protein